MYFIRNPGSKRGNRRCRQGLKISWSSSWTLLVCEFCLGASPWSSESREEWTSKSSPFLASSFSCCTLSLGPKEVFVIFCPSHTLCHMCIVWARKGKKHACWQLFSSRYSRWQLFRIYPLHFNNFLNIVSVLPTAQIKLIYRVKVKT